MKKARYISGLVLIFVLVVSLILPVSAFEDTETRHIENQPPGYDADMFVTEAGIGHGGPLVTVLDPNMDIWAGLFFEDIKVNYWHHVENATLWLRTASSLDFDADSSFTIYGVNDYRYFGLGTKGSSAFGAPSTITSAPLTSAHVNYNSSQFYGPQWWNISVTNIVRELKSNPHWDGPGFDRSDPGDNMAFIMLGASGSDSRWFYALQAGNGMEAKLEIHWGGSSHPPSGYEDAIFNQTYGNYTIWEMPGGAGYPPLDPVEYIFHQAIYNVKYDTAHIAPETPILIKQTSTPTHYIGQRKLVRNSTGTLFAIYHLNTDTKLYIIQSEDDGATWQNNTKFSGVTITPYEPSIAVGSNDTLHIIFRATADGYDDNQIWYVKHNGSWVSPVRISTYAGMIDYPQSGVSFAIDSNDGLHAVWIGKATGFTTHTQIWYAKYDGAWNDPVRISTGDGMNTETQDKPSITLNSHDNIHVAWGEFGTIQYAMYDASWTTPVEIVEIGTAPTIAVDANNYIHVCFEGYETTYEIMHIKYDGAWSDLVRISTYDGMEDNHQLHPTFAIGPDNHIHVLWDGKATGYTFDEVIWYAEYTDSWATPYVVQSTGKCTDPNIRWSRFPAPSENSTFLVVDINGTVLQDDFDNLKDAQDWIDTEYTDPEDPDPAGEWSTGPGGETGAFTRFRMRLWFLLIGFGCLFGPVLFFAWRRPSGYYIMCGAIVMLIGVGLLISITQV